MKYCSRPFKYLHLDPDGEVRSCSWTSNSIGNILKDGVEAVWNGEEAEKVRQSILDGSFSFCQKDFCPFLANNSLPDITKENFEELKQSIKIPEFPPYSVWRDVKNSENYEDLFQKEPQPIELDFAYDKICNHACPTCRDKILCLSDEEKDRIQKTSELMKPYLKDVEFLDICGAGDVFSSPYMMDILKNLDSEKENLIIDLETNGALFDEQHWNQISHIEKYNVCANLTTNSWERDTYTYLNGGVNDYDKLMSNLKFIKSLREEGKIKCLTLSMVIQDRNFRELPEFIRRSFEEFGADFVNLKPVYHWFCLSEEDFWFKDVSNPQHPYHADYKKILEDPVFKDERVYWWDGYNVHDSKQHPAHKSDYIAQMLLKFFYVTDYKEKLVSLIKSKNYGKFAVYGAGDVGQVLCTVLSQTEAKPQFVVDKYRKGNNFCGIDLVNFFKFDASQVDTVIVTPVYYMMTIKQDLRRLGFRGNVVNIMDLIKEL